MMDLSLTILIFILSVLLKTGKGSALLDPSKINIKNVTLYIFTGTVGKTGFIQNTCNKFLNLNLNSLLVKRQIDNPSPGAVTGGN